MSFYHSCNCSPYVLGVVLDWRRLILRTQYGTLPGYLFTTNTRTLRGQDLTYADELTVLVPPEDMKPLIMM
jgi:hypothetical protein